ncbi:TonB-dependent receptor [Pseudohaliea rubra]|uniref:TonB-dependent receptor n=1 Tax=Pseudohaliea rubra DSM 19751 TaxID=1265313 RepID=A0A095VVJ5_9GAMM|nr:TonB-dependent receptor [Pseudohaliea rubra]KGE05385.1 TonB-dependent receptor [Pseudohaliea rubra DSM 19751]
MKHPVTLSRPGLLALACLAAGAGAAPLEEIVVTAELRNTPLLEQSASTSVVDSRTIRQRAARHLEDVLNLAPNVNFAGGSSRARFYQVRGIGERSQFVEPLNPSVGLRIDGVDFSGLGTAALLFDVEQVEVLRGPQGTLHGANALAGLINLRTAAPAAETGGRIEVSAADYDTRTLGAALTGPLTDTLRYRLSLGHNESDGYMDNAWLGRDDTNNRDETNASARLRWLPDTRNSVDLHLFAVDVNNGYDAFSLDNTRSTLSDQPGRDTLEALAGSLKWHREGDAVDLETFLSVASTDTAYAYDEDWAFVGIAPELEYSSFDEFRRERDSVSAEVRLSSRQPLVLLGRPTEWVAGLYGLSDDETLRRRYTFLASDFNSRFEARTAAAYGQLDVALSDVLTLTTGLRVAHRTMDYGDSNGVDATPSDDLWGGKLSLAWDLADGGLLYASVSRGYRASGVNAGVLATDPGSVNDGAPVLAANTTFDQERLWNYELGHKALLADGRLSSRLALFWMDRQDQQVRGSLVLPRPDGSTAFIDYTDNADTGTNLGLEWELNWQPTDSLAFFASLGLLDATFDDYVNAAGDDLDGRDQAHAPNYQYAAGVTWTSPGGWYVRAEAEGKDGFYFSDRHAARAGAYDIFHLRGGLRTTHWDASLWVRNLGDEDYTIRGFGSFGNDPRKGYAVEPYYQYGEPRVLGGSVAYRF